MSVQPQIQPTQNILDSIISPKIVGDETGYTIKIDIQNVDNITTTGDVVIGGTLGSSDTTLVMTSNIDLYGHSLVNTIGGITIEKLNISDNIISALPLDDDPTARPIVLGSNLDLNANTLFTSGGDIKIGINSSDNTLITGNLTTTKSITTTGTPSGMEPTLGTISGYAFSAGDGGISSSGMIHANGGLVLSGNLALPDGTTVSGGFSATTINAGNSVPYGGDINVGSNGIISSGAITSDATIIGRNIYSQGTLNVATSVTVGTTNINNSYGIVTNNLNVVGNLQFGLSQHGSLYDNNEQRFIFVPNSSITSNSQIMLSLQTLYDGTTSYDITKIDDQNTITVGSSSGLNYGDQIKITSLSVVDRNDVMLNNNIYYVNDFDGNNIQLTLYPGGPMINLAEFNNPGNAPNKANAFQLQSIITQKAITYTLIPGYGFTIHNIDGSIFGSTGVTIAWFITSNGSSAY